MLYSMEIKCTSLRYSNNYSCLLNDLEGAHCLMISSASEVLHLSVSRCLFLTAPNNITQLLDNLQFWYRSHQFFYILITHISTVLQSPGVCPHTSPRANNFQFWYRSHEFFYILITNIVTPHQTQFSQVWQTGRH